jgi:hypothetical protein
VSQTEGLAPESPGTGAGSTCIGGGVVEAALPGVEISVVGSSSGTLPNGAEETSGKAKTMEMARALNADFIGFNLLSFISTVRSMERYGLI